MSVNVTKNWVLNMVGVEITSKKLDAMHKHLMNGIKELVILLIKIKIQMKT